jgi:hypothetical protein
MKALMIGVVLFAACHRDRPEQPPPPATAPKPPVRGAAGDEDLRVMLAEIASSKACDMIEGQFLPLRAPDRPDVRTGVLWIRHCTITNDGTRVTFALSGNGWQWADQTKHEAGGKFVVREYVKFDVTATVHGTLDLAYARGDHVLSLWYSPAAPPQIDFTPIGVVEVDREGVWSSIVGAVGSVLGQGPEKQGEQQAKHQGSQQFETQLGSGLTVAVDLCSGYQRFTLGRAPKGKLGPPNPGDSRQAPFELHRGGLSIYGPQPAPDGMTVDVDTDGPTRVGLACADEAERAADAFAHDGPRELIHTLAQAEVNGHARLHAKPVRCKVAMIARTDVAKVTLRWERPHAERARALGGPMVRCAR